MSYRNWVSDRPLISLQLPQLQNGRIRHGFAASGRLKRMLLGSVGFVALGLAVATSGTPAAAQDFFSAFSSPFYSTPRYGYPRYRPRHRAVRRETEEVKPSKPPFGDLPKGPLQIIISVDQQRLHFYADGVHVADAPVATGVPGHLTPLGVFSVIERDRYHHSNIYSGAPMPYMERITWSGVALHEGPGVGHQASHGCIRMPQAFAAHLWTLPTMGMRVIIARQELKPVDFADPHLFVHRDAPVTSSLPSAVETAQKVDPGTQSDAIDPAASAAASAPQPVAPATPQPASGTATSADATPASATPADAPPAQASAPDTGAPGTASAPALPNIVKAAASDATAPTQPVQSAPTQPSESAATAPTTPTTPTTAPTQPSESTATAPTTPSTPATSPVQPGESATSAPATPTTPTTGTVPQPSAPANPSVAATPSAPSQTTTPAPAASTAAPSPAPAASAAVAPASSVAPISLDMVPLPLSRPGKIAQGGDAPIAIFISRKEGKIYVRQNFTAVFETPVKIENPQQPLGTYVFTAMDYMPDHSTLRWNVVAMPYSPEKTVERYRYTRDYYGRLRRVRVVEHVAAADTVEAPVATPQQALARIQIPQDAIDQISRLIVPGSSLVVSDQGLGRETGRGTDFIVVQR